MNNTIYTELKNELNSILDTKNQIKNILLTNGSEITDETKFSEYPTIISNLLTNIGNNFNMDNIIYDTDNIITIPANNTLYQATTAGIVQYTISMTGAFNAYIQCKKNKNDDTPLSRTGGYIAGDANLNLTLFIPKNYWYSCNYTIQNIGENKQNTVQEIVLMRFIPIKINN